MSFLNTVKGLVAQAERAAAQVKTGAVASRQVVKATPRAAVLHVLPEQEIDGVWYRELAFTNLDLYEVAREARDLQIAGADRSTGRAESRTPITGGSGKFLPVRKGGGAGKTGKANSVPQVLVEGPVAKMSNAAKKEVVKRVKKNTPAGMGWHLSQMVGEVSATVARAKAIIAKAAGSFGELPRSLPVSRAVEEAKAIVAEAPSVYRYLARKARAVVASIREVAV